jgi:peptide/nickel transport system substrate-binding protein
MAKKQIFSLLLIFTLVILPLLATCEGKEITPTQTSPQSTVGINWWDKFGEPQYGGTITLGGNYFPTWDPYLFPIGVFNFYFEHLWITDWTLDRKIWSRSTLFTPVEYYKGLLAASWEQANPLTYIVHLRQGIHWQNKPPVNGREFTAYDVEYNYDRLLGTGSGFTQPAPMFRRGALQKVTATDDYTVVFKFSSPSAWNFYTIANIGGDPIVAPEIAKPGEPITDWHNAVGSGPWMVADYVEGASLTMSKNPDYWGYDERHPRNQLPYADRLKLLMIKDLATRLAALRSGKICFLDSLDWQQAKSLAETNPGLGRAELPFSGQGPDYIVDNEPFSDIRVRKALEMAIDRKTVAQTYYGGIVDGTPCGPVNPIYKGFCYSYEDWPQILKDEYSYNAEGARKLLAEAGYPHGFKTKLAMDSHGDVALAQIIKSYFTDIGVDMEIETMEGPVFSSLQRSGKLDQMYWNPGGNTGTIAGPNIGENYLSTYRLNYSHINDPAYDALYDKFKKATVMDEAKQLLVEVDKYIIEQHWALRIFTTANYTFWQPYFKGYSGEKIELFTGSPGGWPWARFWIDQELKKSMGH